MKIKFTVKGKLRDDYTIITDEAHYCGVNYLPFRFALNRCIKYTIEGMIWDDNVLNSFIETCEDECFRGITKEFEIDDEHKEFIYEIFEDDCELMMR